MKLSQGKLRLGITKGLLSSDWTLPRGCSLDGWLVPQTGSPRPWHQAWQCSERVRTNHLTPTGWFQAALRGARGWT